MVLADMLLPWQDKLETIRALRKVDPQVKISALSATPTPDMFLGYSIPARS
jgi:DNA-binding NarL/FixJ family response regulator